MGLEIWLPTKARRELVCLTCGEARFYKDQRAEYERHAIRCSMENEDTERRMSLRTRLGPVFGGDYVDEELESWVAKRRQQIIDGTVKL